MPSTSSYISNSGASVGRAYRSDDVIVTILRRDQGENVNEPLVEDIGDGSVTLKEGLSCCRRRGRAKARKSRQSSSAWRLTFPAAS